MKLLLTIEEKVCTELEIDTSDLGLDFDNETERVFALAEFINEFKADPKDILYHYRDEVDKSSEISSVDIKPIEELDTDLHLGED